MAWYVRQRPDRRVTVEAPGISNRPGRMVAQQLNFSSRPRCGGRQGAERSGGAGL